jgi:hypothetical protein
MLRGKACPPNLPPRLLCRFSDKATWVLRNLLRRPALSRRKHAKVLTIACRCVANVQPKVVSTRAGDGRMMIASTWAIQSRPYSA